jgi:hypothetical protein
MENCMESPQKTRTRTAIQSSHSTARDIPEGISLHNKGTCTAMVIVALLPIAKLWKKPGCPTTDEWIKKCGIYSTTKKNEILSFSGK